MRFLIIVLTLVSPPLFADGALITDYRWENIKGGLFDGECIEYDRQTQGRMFKKRAAAENCKTGETQLAFHFPSGECVEVDAETGGKNYLSKTDIENCKTPNTVTKLQTFGDQSGCYEYDFPSKGKEYYKKLKMQDCSENVQSYFFKQTSKSSGECFAKDNDEKLIPVKLEFCKPESTLYIFKLKDRTSGYCYEQAIEGEEFYIDEVAKKHCRPNETEYVYIKQEGQKNGRCFLVDKETAGKKYIELTSLKNCK
ncbi:MAG: hypothetical protein CME62_01515 [Halobacteriovoraceae bacterium]|nr:hypothetical protein [Halobacteriovoraceae bacterium]|tara:strand:+ start:4907 stop:5668 length:762 start_codon:yes stop_codon:yes gene_type:complete